MRALVVGSVFIAGLALPIGVNGQSNEAQAFGDRCYRDVAVRGATRNSMAGAREAAIGAWEVAARQRHGARFADWYYSGDRSIDCDWNAPGRRFWCKAVAIPCGRVG